ncbi:MAG: hypothetical protein BWY85_02208 [Firmicutes bacterium ADurb.Bin506]|nr:MAG: hypothetical protein BWY85_02208 [Firmicutes bacterium ADurb.Bin506]
MRRHPRHALTFVGSAPPHHDVECEALPCDTHSSALGTHVALLAPAPRTWRRDNGGACATTVAHVPADCVDADRRLESREAGGARGAEHRHRLLHREVPCRRHSLLRLFIEEHPSLHLREGCVHQLRPQLAGSPGRGLLACLICTQMHGRAQPLPSGAARHSACRNLEPSQSRPHLTMTRSHELPDGRGSPCHRPLQQLRQPRQLRHQPLPRRALRRALCRPRLPALPSPYHSGRGLSGPSRVGCRQRTSEHCHVAAGCEVHVSPGRLGVGSHVNRHPIRLDQQEDMEHGLPPSWRRCCDSPVGCISLPCPP